MDNRMNYTKVHTVSVKGGHKFDNKAP